jgi:alpha-tubulin suppressor-like RCC1 family protein
VTAALTAGNDLYLWGGRVGQPKILDGMTGEPTPFDLDGEDVMDIAVGNDHILALSVDYRLFVVGSGRNGQLGIEGGLQLDEWMEIVLPLKHGYRPVSVYAGYKTSFVLVEAFE